MPRWVKGSPAAVKDGPQPNTPARPQSKSELQAALGAAVEAGEVDKAKLLIAEGADAQGRFVQRDGTAGATYLMLAVESGRWAMLDDALARPHDLKATDAAGASAMVLMSSSAPIGEDFLEPVDQMLAAGADREDLGEVLLKAGVDPLARNRKGKTAEEAILKGVWGNKEQTAAAIRTFAASHKGD